jgi:hypothetical protein
MRDDLRISCHLVWDFLCDYECRKYIMILNCEVEYTLNWSQNLWCGEVPILPLYPRVPTNRNLIVGHSNGNVSLSFHSKFRKPVKYLNSFLMSKLRNLSRLFSRAVSLFQRLSSRLSESTPISHSPYWISSRFPSALSTIVNHISMIFSLAEAVSDAINLIRFIPSTRTKKSILIEIMRKCSQISFPIFVDPTPHSLSFIPRLNILWLSFHLIELFESTRAFSRFIPVFHRLPELSHT